MGIDHKRKSGGEKHQKAMAPLCPASTDRKLCVRSTRQEDVKPCFPALQTWVSRPINRPFRSAVCQLLSPCGLCWWEQLWHNRVLCCPSCRLTQFHLYGHSVERLSQGKEGWWSGFWWTSIAAQVLVVLQNPPSRPTVRFYRARTSFFFEWEYLKGQNGSLGDFLFVCICFILQKCVVICSVSIQHDLMG